MTSSPLPSARGAERILDVWGWLAGRSVRGRAEALLAVIDISLVIAAYVVVLTITMDFAGLAEAWARISPVLLVALMSHIAANVAVGLYGPVWQHASIREARLVTVAGTVGTVAVVLLTATLIDTGLVPSALLAGFATTGMLGLLRFQSRLFAYRRRGEQSGAPVVIIGAGRAAANIIRELEHEERPALRVVAAVDDDPAKVGRWLHGVQVAGTLEDLARVAQAHDARQLLLAVPSADSELIRRVADIASECLLPLKVLPPIGEMVDGSPRLRDVRDISIDDILGRKQIETDLEAVASLLRGRRVLVTGGGGSIGSEIVRQVASFGPAAVGVLDHDETHIFDAVALVGGAATPLLVDVTDPQQVSSAFDEFCPEIVFHAAAHKHVPLLEAHPCRAGQTNVLGTRNVIAAAKDHDVEHLVFVSTDKAVRPANVMGASKRIGEQLVLSARPEGAAWSAVRFGNVLGSRGSVVPTFVRQIGEGGPVTITHEDMTRYFMSIPEAVQLVLQSAALAQGGEIFMLDMGEPVRIMDLARRMITLAGHRPGVDVELRVVGLRPGEKLEEELHVPAEAPAPTSHPSITRLSPPLHRADVLASAIRELSLAVAEQDDRTVREVLFRVARMAVEDAQSVQGDVERDVLIVVPEPEASVAA